jgi:nucleoside phosphorylase
MLAHDYHVGWIAALPLEGAAALDMLDEEHEHILQANQDDNNYFLGRIGLHNVVITVLPYMGSVPAAVVAAQMRNTFPSLRFVLLVGIGGGAPTPTHDVRLGDVVVSRPTEQYSGVIQYDFGKTLHEGRFKITGSLNRPSAILLTATSSLEARHRRQGGSQISAILEETGQKDLNRQEACNPPTEAADELFEPSYAHPRPTDRSCDDCDRRHLVNTRPLRTNSQPMIHYGLIASANQVMRDALTRDRLSAELDVLCFEMEAAGLMNYFECLVIRGICDYSDSHKNKQWQEYAAATAAAYAKELLMIIAPTPSFQATMADRTYDSGIAGGYQLNQMQRPHSVANSVASQFATNPFNAMYPNTTRTSRAAAESGKHAGIPSYIILIDSASLS